MLFHSTATTARRLSLSQIPRALSLKFPASRWTQLPAPSSFWSSAPANAAWPRSVPNFLNLWHVQGISDSLETWSAICGKLCRQSSMVQNLLNLHLGSGRKYGKKATRDQTKSRKLPPTLQVLLIHWKPRPRGNWLAEGESTSENK